MTSRIMSDAEIRRRKKTQGHVSQATGALGLAALGGTLAASRTGRGQLRKIPALKNKIAAPPPKDPNRDRIQGAITPVLATSAGLGGASSFNFAAYTGAESRKRKQAVPAPVKKDIGMDMGYFGEEGHPVKLPEIKVPIEKAWEPVASSYSPEGSRKKRAKAYETGALVGAGAGGAVAASQGTKAVQAGKKVKVVPNAAQLKPVKEGSNLVTRHGKSFKALDIDTLKPALKHGGKAAAGVAAVGAATYGHKKLKEKQSGSWQSYGKALTMDEIEKNLGR